MGTRGQEWGVSPELAAILYGPRFTPGQARERMASSPAMRALQDANERSSAAPPLHDDGERFEPASWVTRLSDASLIARLEQSSEKMRAWDNGGGVDLQFIGPEAGREEQTILQLVSEGRRRLWGS